MENFDPLKEAQERAVSITNIIETRAQSEQFWRGQIAQEILFQKEELLRSLS